MPRYGVSRSAWMPKSGANSTPRYCARRTELHHDAFISDHTWNRLAACYNIEQLMNTVFAVGQYHLVSMALNTFGVQFEPDTTDRFPF